MGGFYVCLKIAKRTCMKNKFVQFLKYICVKLCDPQVLSVLLPGFFTKKILLRKAPDSQVVQFRHENPRVINKMCVGLLDLCQIC